MYITYWFIKQRNAWPIQIFRFDRGDVTGSSPSECHWIVPGTVGIDD